MLELQAILQLDFLVIEKLKSRQDLLFACAYVLQYFTNMHWHSTMLSVKKQICLMSFSKSKYIYEFVLFCYYGHHFKKETGTYLDNYRILT